MRILALLRSEIRLLPPFINNIRMIADSSHEIEVLARIDPETEITMNKKKIKTHNLSKYSKSVKILSDYAFYKTAWNTIKSGGYDLLWVGSLDTAIILGRKLKKQKYILQINELYDVFYFYKKAMIYYARHSAANVVPEKNRAFIIKSWAKINDIPFVMPNKYEEEFVDSIGEDAECASKKQIIYQGIMGKERPLEAFARAVGDDSLNMEMILVGAWNNYLESLLKYRNVRYVGYINPPNHLKYTKKARIGIITYDDGSLNRVFCAPNKLWEYACFGIPMISCKLPGVSGYIEKYEAGICVDTKNETEIKEALIAIEKNYIFYSRQSRLLYESIDNKETVRKILSFVK